MLIARMIYFHILLTFVIVKNRNISMSREFSKPTQIGFAAEFFWLSLRSKATGKLPPLNAPLTFTF